MKKVFLHVDLDAFFASVEQLDHPEYRGKPVIIGGLPGDRRAVVSTASYEARKYGVHSAMPLVQAVKLCPNAIYIRGNYHRYAEKSRQVMEIFQNYSPTIVQISIDEAFIDLTGTQRLFGDPVDVAKKIKKEVKEKTGLTVSVGLASSMYLSKIASDLHKPDGLTVVPDGQEENFMLNLPMERIWGIGAKTQEHLKNAGLKTNKDIHEKSLTLLTALFGANTGNFLYEAVRGKLDMEFGAEAKSRSISSETTFEFDLTELYAIETSIMYLVNHVMYRMHLENVRSRTVMLKLRYEDFTTVTIQETSQRQIMNSDDMFERCKNLLHKKYESGRGIRLIGVACCNLENKNELCQKELFDFGDSKKALVENAIYKMEQKNPDLKIRKARLLDD